MSRMTHKQAVDMANKAMDRTMNATKRKATDDELRKLYQIIPAMAGGERGVSIVEVELDGNTFVCQIDVVGDWDDWSLDSAHVA